MRLEIIIDELTGWFKKTFNACKYHKARPWCTLGFKEDITLENIRKHFDRSELNTEYKKKRSNTDNATLQPYAHIQAEIHSIYGAHKSFVARHKSRLQFYRDDCAQKGFHTLISVYMGHAKLRAEKEYYAERSKQ